MKLKELWHKYRAWQKDSVHYSADGLEEHRCPNCGHEFKGNYCPVCRQDAGDGRITWKWVFRCVMTVWGMDSRSLPHTLLQLILRPGYLIGDYITGRRQVSYTPVNMLFIVALIYVVTKQLFGVDVEVQAALSTEDNMAVFRDAIHWMQANPAWAVMAMTMVMVLPTRYFFRFAPRHSHHTLPEGIIIQLFMASLMMMCLLVGVFSEPLSSLLILFYYYISYRQLFGFGRWSTLWRLILSLIVWLLVVVFFVLMGMLLPAIKTHSMDYVLGYMLVAAVVLIVTVLIVVFGYFIGWKTSKKTLDTENNR